MLWHVASSVFSVPERQHFSLPFLVATLPPGGLDATLDFPILLFKSPVQFYLHPLLKHLIFHTFTVLGEFSQLRETKQQYS